MNDEKTLNLQNKLGYNFKCVSLLRTALTHSSYANESRKKNMHSNERLEFLGDSVLGMAVAELIYTHKAELTEGQMTKLRAELVCERSLADLAIAFGIDECILLGKGEEKGGGRHRPSILSDALEAVIAAIYLDGDYAEVFTFIKRVFIPRVNIDKHVSSDYKTMLQEIIQEKGSQVLSYHIVEESGPDHNKTFYVEVRLNGAVIGSGNGKSKKEAEQDAAKYALGRVGK